MKHFQALRAFLGVTEVTDVTDVVFSEYMDFPFSTFLLGAKSAESNPVGVS